MSYGHLLAVAPSVHMDAPRGTPPAGPLLDRHGQPFIERIERVLRQLAPRLCRRYPALDDVVLTEVLEEAAQRIVTQEAEAAPIEHLQGYAWRTMRSVAIDRLRRSTMRVASATLAPDKGGRIIATLPSSDGPDQIEGEVLWREVLAMLSPDEQMICIWKMAGFSAREIATRRGSSVAAVNVAFWRAKRRIRQAISSPRRARRAVADEGANRPRPAGRRETDGTNE